MKKLLLGLIFIFVWSSLFAETIALKSGKTLEGKIIEETAEYIKIDFAGVPLTYFLDEIESINGKKIEKISLPDILAKRTQAIRNIPRLKLEILTEMNKPEVTRMINELIMDFDFAQRKAYQSSQIKELVLAKDEAMDRELSARLRQKIKELQGKGMPEEKISEIENRMQELIQQIKAVSTKLSEEIKKIETNTYIIDDLLYINVLDKWAKTQDADLGKVWELFAAFDKDGLKKISEEISGLGSLGLLLDLLFGIPQEAAPVYEVLEDKFQGQPCYVLSLKQGEGYAALRESIKATISSLMITKEEDADFDLDKINIESLSAGEYIAKDSFLPLYSINEVQLSLPLKKPIGGIDKIYIFQKQSSFFSYPLEDIVLPSSAEGAGSAKNIEEAMQMLKPSLPDF